MIATKRRKKSLASMDATDAPIGARAMLGVTCGSFLCFFVANNLIRT